MLVTGFITNKEKAVWSLLPSLIMRFLISVVGLKKANLSIKKASSQRALNK